MKKELYQSINSRIEAFNEMINYIYHPLVCNYDFRPKENSVEEFEIRISLMSRKSGNTFGFAISTKFKENSEIKAINIILEKFHEEIKKYLYKAGIEKIENYGSKNSKKR